MKVFIAKLAERAAKTFLQFYFANWIYFGDGAVDYEHLFTEANVKAGVVGLALSVATSVGTKNVGPDNDSPSVV